MPEQGGQGRIDNRLKKRNLWGNCELNSPEAFWMTSNFVFIRQRGEIKSFRDELAQTVLKFTGNDRLFGSMELNLMT